DPDPQLGELTHHFFQATPALEAGDGRAARYAERAALQAMRHLAFEEAAGFYEAALRGLDALPPADPAERCRLLLCLGEARASAGDRPAAEAAFRRAMEQARRLAGRPRGPAYFARAVLVLAGHGLLR